MKNTPQDSKELQKIDSNSEFDELLKMAKEGDAVAQNNLAVIYHEKSNYKEAFNLFELAAKAGNNQARYNLGSYYLNGFIYDNNKSNFSKAAKWLHLAALDGNQPAQKSLEYVIDSLKYEAQENNPAGQNDLGICYWFGYGVTKNEMEAIRLFDIALKAGYNSAKRNLESCLKNETLKQKWQQISTDSKSEATSVQKAKEKEQENPYARLAKQQKKQNKIEQKKKPNLQKSDSEKKTESDMVKPQESSTAQKEKMSKSMKKRLKRKKAKEDGKEKVKTTQPEVPETASDKKENKKNPPAKTEKPKSKEELESERKKVEEAINSITAKKATDEKSILHAQENSGGNIKSRLDLISDGESGDAKSQYTAGSTLLKATNKITSQINRNSAVKLLTRSANQGYRPAQTLLGVEYILGEKLEQDYKKAIPLLQMASNQGGKKAKYYLGKCYFNGEGVHSNIDLGVRLISESAALGFDKAQKVFHTHLSLSTTDSHTPSASIASSSASSLQTLQTKSMQSMKK